MNREGGMTYKGKSAISPNLHLQNFPDWKGFLKSFNTFKALCESDGLCISSIGGLVECLLAIITNAMSYI